MATLYSEKYWFPTGVLATNTTAVVFPEGSNTFASLFANAAGTIPLTNPLNTDGFGFLTFYAEPGNYWVHIDSETFFINVGMSQEQADLSTGVASGGALTIGGPTTLNIAPVDGWIVDYLADNKNVPVITRVKTSVTQSIPLSAASLLRPITWWLMDSAGTVIQQGAQPTPPQLRQFMSLGSTTLTSGVLILTQSVPTILPQPANQFVDLMDGLKPFRIDGNVISPNGANLSFNQSAGRVFSRGFGHYSGGVATDNPHTPTTIAQTPAQFRIGTQTTTAFGAPVSVLDVGNYDVGGVVTPIPGGANTATNFRVWINATGSAPDQVVLQYGQVTFGSLSAAISAIGSGPFNVNPAISFAGILIGYISVIKSATNLSDPTQAVFTQATKFAER